MYFWASRGLDLCRVVTGIRITYLQHLLDVDSLGPHRAIFVDVGSVDNVFVAAALFSILIDLLFLELVEQGLRHEGVDVVNENLLRH